MEIEELALGARAYNVLKNAGIDTVEDLCLLTALQLLGLENFGKKSLQDVIQVLEGHSHSLHAEPADRRLVLSCPGDGSRFNLGLSMANRDSDLPARATSDRGAPEPDSSARRRSNPVSVIGRDRARGACGR
jgi:hypothetical protein